MPALGACADSNSLDEAGGLRELTKDDFWQYMEDAGDKLCVIDFFTDWCAAVGQLDNHARPEPLRWRCRFGVRDGIAHARSPFRVLAATRLRTMPQQCPCMWSYANFATLIN